VDDGVGHVRRAWRVEQADAGDAGGGHGGHRSGAEE
jgi:hypothetical protein